MKIKRPKWIKAPRLPGQDYVYVFEIRRKKWSFKSVLGRCKAGYSNDAIRRASEFERSVFDDVGIKVDVTVFTAAPVYYPRTIETVLHRAVPMRWLKSDDFKEANGGTEVFKVFNWFCGLMLYVIAWGWSLPFEAPLLIGLFIMFQPRPLDMATYLWILYFFQLAFILFVAVAAIWLLWTLGISLIYFL